MESANNNTRINCLQRRILIATIAFFFLLYNLQAILNHYFFRTNALDYGFHLQAFWNFIHFRTGILTIFHVPLESYFQIHPSFTLVIITPFCWLLKPLFGSYTLLIVQNIFLTIGGFFTYKTVFLKSKHFVISLLAAIHYFLLWGHFSAIAFEYIDATIAASMIPVFFYLYFKEKYWAAIVTFIFIITSRENMPIWFMFIGLFLLIEFYKSRKDVKMALGIIFFSMLYLLFIFKVLIPLFHSDGYNYNRFQYSLLGENIPQALIFVIKHPIETIKLLFINHLSDSAYNGVKLEFWLVFLVSGGILLFRRPHYLLLFVPIIAQKLFSNDYQMWGINIFYSIEIVSILSIAAFMIIIKFKNQKFALYTSVCLCIITFSITVIKMNSRTSKWYDASKEKIYDRSFYSTKYNLSEIKKVLNEIPENARVCANQKIIPHLAFRDKIYYYPYINDAEYLVFLLKSSTYPLSNQDFDQKLKELYSSSEWVVIKQTEDILVFKKKSTL